MPPKPKPRADKIDAYVGSKIRENRMLKGLSQEELARGLDISYQQIQKYERGANRVGASRLYYIGRALGIPVSTFFTGLPILEPGAIMENSQFPTSVTDQPDRDRQSLELMRSYHAVRDRGLKRKIYELVKAAGQV